MVTDVVRKEMVTTTVDGGYGQQKEEEEEILVFMAGASLIAPEVIMTAAHKVKEFK